MLHLWISIGLTSICWVVHNSLRDFRPLRYSIRDGHAEGEHFNRGRDTASFCPTLQVLDMSTLGDATDVNLVIKFLPYTLHVCSRNLIIGLTSAASPRVDISSSCNVGQKLTSVSPSIGMLPFGATIPDTVPQRSVISEGLTNYPVHMQLIICILNSDQCRIFWNVTSV